jgi:hypothetical protein
MKVLMFPQLSKFDSEESGIKRVVEAYHRYASSIGVEYVDCRVEDENLYDLFAVHAGSTDRFPTRKPICAHLHGLYFTSDYQANNWEWKANAHVIETIRRSIVITVPSEWVGETMRRDVRVYPFVVPHGIETSEWEHDFESERYVLWNKNRVGDVCNPEAVKRLAMKYDGTHFITTFAPTGSPPNVKAIGLVDHERMKSLVQRAHVYLSTTKETFGVGILEALASGVPVLGFDYGGNRMLIQHCVNGYLARPNDYDDLAVGLAYCAKYHDILGKNARITARLWTWEKAMEKLKMAYDEALSTWVDKQRLMRVEL